ncbi:NAD/NADP octopine/nopaline dehydrogenase [Trichoderma simmonsii]|uniref:NAD/NADP octopine/nopaline dehydrogenase n=1 Tax=Trichoderma simmonsii TaxID=1491479 RepID=A0A8G0PEY2_9HYPO|nr:NAD/NADP octopine/nopaline dehydrogenase [Trichoderma simmonsii]
MQRKVSIVGAGPSGFALVADLQSRGIDALVYSHPDHLRYANEVMDSGLLTARGKIEGSMPVCITSDMGDIIEFSTIIIITVPSTGHETVLQELRRFPLQHHTIICIPGNLFSLVADIEIGCVLETNLSPYSCRMERDVVTILGKKNSIFIAALQSPPSQAVYDAVQGIMPVELCWCSSVLEVCLLNINGVFHPLMMLMNAGRIEDTGGDFFLYRDGLTSSVAKAMIVVDQVRMQIVDLARNSGPHKGLKAPSDLQNRNISEDVPDLLVCWHSLAEKLGIDASPIKAVIVLAQMTTGVDYLQSGRSLQKLRLEDISRRELIARFTAQPDNFIVSRL